jgi:hypothetical protein
MSMDQIPSWEANSHSASQETPRHLQNSKVPYFVQKSEPLDPILSQMNALHVVTPYSSKIHIYW